MSTPEQSPDQDAPTPPGGPLRTDAPAGTPPAAGTTEGAAGGAGDPVHDDAGEPPRTRPTDDTGIVEPTDEAGAHTDDPEVARQQENAGTTADEPSQ